MAFYKYWNKYVFDCYKKISKYNNIECKKKRDKLFKKSIEAIESKKLFNNEIMGLFEEIRLFDYLNKIKLNANFIKETNKGSPDMMTDIGYIECVSMSEGAGKNKEIYDKIMSGHLNRYKAGEPRLTTSLCEKRQKYEAYLINKVIDDKKPRIIAINTSLFSDNVHSSEAEDIMLKILYGLGTQCITFNKNNNDDDKIAKYIFGTSVAGGNCTFESGYFCNNSFNEISAVILNNNATCEDISKNYCKMFLNPFAKIQVDETKLKDIIYLKKDDEYNDTYIWVNKEKTNELDA